MKDVTNESAWAGQVALVSGAGSESGIGFASARRLARNGAKLLLTASSERVLLRAEELCGEGFEARALAADLTDENDVRRLAEWAQAQWGRVDVLVNNAGMAMQGSPEPFAELAAMDLATWNLSLARNLTSAFLLTRALLPGMLERGYGRIVNVLLHHPATQGFIGRLAFADFAHGFRVKTPHQHFGKVIQRGCHA